MSKILNPVLNNQVRETPPLNLPDGVSTIYANVNADRDLIVTLLQSFDKNETFDKIEVRQYTAADGDKTFNFDKVGQDVILTLENVSGADCSFTRALLDFKYSNISSSISSEVSDAQTHIGLTSVQNILLAGINVSNTDFGFLGDINTTLNAGLNTSDSTTHTKLDNVTGEIVSIKQLLQSDIVNVEDISVRDKLDTVNNNLSIIDNTLNNNVIDTCTKLCRPLQVKSVFITTAGATAINLLNGPLKLVSFIYAHSDNQGLLSFYDAAASSAAPTVNDTAYFLAPSTTNTLSCPSFPASSFINFNNGLWIRASSNIDPANSVSEAATITLFYET